MNTTTITPAELISALIASGEFATDAAIARESGRSAQTIHRWHTGKVGAISQDDMADLLVDLDMNPDDWGVTPSREWRRRNESRQAPPELADMVRSLLERATFTDTPPMWFTQHMDQIHAELREIKETILDEKDD